MNNATLHDGCEIKQMPKSLNVAADAVLPWREIWMEDENINL